MERRQPRGRFCLAAIGLLSTGALDACMTGSNGAAPGQRSGTGGVGGQDASVSTIGGVGGLPGKDTSDAGSAGITSGPAPAESAGVLLIRRLTNREYDHMLADLLGDTTAPAESGSAGARDAPNAVGYVAPDTVPDAQVEFYRQTADSVVDRALHALAAGEFAGKLVIPCEAPADSAAEIACATRFVATFGQEAYRRPVAAPEQDSLLNVFSSVRTLGLTFNESIGAVVKVMIESPNFLYHWEIGPAAPTVDPDGLAPLTPWQLASRLASLLWETMPDAVLLQAARSGQLATPAQIGAQVTRMLADDRAANGLFSFHAQWLFNFGSEARDSAKPLTSSNPLYTESVATSIQAELRRFVSSVYAGDGTLESLFTAPYTYVNHDLAALYGVPDPGDGLRENGRRPDGARRRVHSGRLPGHIGARRPGRPCPSWAVHLSQGLVRQHHFAARYASAGHAHRQRDDTPVVRGAWSGGLRQQLSHDLRSGGLRIRKLRRDWKISGHRSGAARRLRRFAGDAGRSDDQLPRRARPFEAARRKRRGPGLCGATMDSVHPGARREQRRGRLHGVGVRKGGRDTRVLAAGSAR